MALPKEDIGFIEQNAAIEELAESIKELVRIIKCFPNYHKLLNHPNGPSINGRLEAVYRKAMKAKSRVVE